MKRITSAFIRHYCAPTMMADGQQGTWYAEYDGIWTVREFVVCLDHRTAVAPFDLALRGPGHPTELPALAGIAPISLRAFESVWEQFAQARLHELALAHAEGGVDAGSWYFHVPFPAELKTDEAASDIYTEYAAGVARRSFEVFADHTLVAPYDVGVPEGDIDEMFHAVREGVGPDEEPIDPRLRPQEISHAIFETSWEQWALPRLRVLAALPSSTSNREPGLLTDTPGGLV